MGYLFLFLKHATLVVGIILKSGKLKKNKIKSVNLKVFGICP